MHYGPFGALINFFCKKEIQFLTALVTKLSTLIVKIFWSFLMDWARKNKSLDRILGVIHKWRHANLDFF